MRGVFLAAAAAVVVARGAVAQAGAGVRELRLDAGHSDVEFTIGFMMSTVRGRFDGLRGSLFYDERDPARSSITLVIAVKSLNTGSAHRDEHLKSADFFDAAKYPAIVFQSTGVERRGDGLSVRGTLAMHGVTREVTIPFHALHPVLDDPHGSTLATFAGSVRLARKDFGILGGNTFNDWFDSLRSATMADSADISLQVAGWETDYARNKNAQVDSAIARIARDGVAATVARARELVAKNPAALSDGERNLDQIGRTLLARGKREDALAIFALETELFPTSSGALTSRGAAHEALGERPAALADYDRALAIDPLDPRALERRRRVAAVTSDARTRADRSTTGPPSPSR
ncbi:MAG: YceI family protein [Gemmatimonadaceae bacterium]